jgi:hypothetical protein
MKKIINVVKFVIIVINCFGRFSLGQGPRTLTGDFSFVLLLSSGPAFVSCDEQLFITAWFNIILSKIYFINGKAFSCCEKLTVNNN